MKAKDIRNKSNKELQKDLSDSRSKILQLSVDYRTKEIKNVREIRAVKRTVARILTVMAEQEVTNQGDKS